MTITIFMPMPAKALSPNARVHWSKRHKARKAQRNHAKLLVRSELAPNHTPWKSGEVEILVFPPDRRRRDRDNYLASMKGIFDGAEDAGLIENDCGFTYKPIQFDEPRKENPGVEITFTQTR